MKTSKNNFFLTAITSACQSVCRLARPHISRLTLAFGIFALILAGFVVGAGEVLSTPAHRVVGAPPSVLNVRSVVIPYASGGALSGWFGKGGGGSGAVLLLHGVRSDRRQMAARSKALLERGYSVLLVDLPAHGESAGERITFGYREAEGVRASLRFLEQTLPGEKIAVIGVSLGAASFVLSNVSPAPSAVVLESMYPTIEEAVADRLRLRAGSFGAFLTPLLLTQLPLRLEISADQLRPIDHLSSIHTPILIASGTEDRHTTIAETEHLFEAAAQPKELWLVDGAAHVDLYHFNPKAYEEKVFTFLDRHLRNVS